MTSTTSTETGQQDEAAILEEFAKITARSRNSAKFPNWWSRLLLQKQFDRQFIIPERPPWPMRTLLSFVERVILRPDVSQISIDRPIFLIGLPRSGTSMLQDIICEHPDTAFITIAMHGHRESFCAVEVLRKLFNIDCEGSRYLGDSIIVNAGSANDAVCFWGEWLKYSVYDLDFVDRKLSDYTPAEIDKIKTDIKKMIWCFGGPSGGNRRFVSKNPMIVQDMTLVGEMFPDAKFVHIIRDPRLAANSLRKLYWLDRAQLAHLESTRSHDMCNRGPIVPFPRLPGVREVMDKYGPGDLRTSAHVWRLAIEHVEANKHKLPAYYEVRYEDIQQNPVDEMAKIFEFCELSVPGEENEAYWRRINNVGKLTHQNRYAEFDIVEEICGEQMRRLGYA